MKNPFRRRPLLSAPPEDAPRRVTGVLETEIAVGSLTGIAPSRIVRHAVIVLDDEDGIRIATTCCRHELPQLISRAGIVALGRAVEANYCEHGDES